MAAHHSLKIALVQLAVTNCKHTNVRKAVEAVRNAKKNDATVVVLPECFNSPYGSKYFPIYAEQVPDGETCQLLSECAKDNKVYLVGGSIPEVENSKYYNTCTVWSPAGELIAKHRKIHLFDIDIPGKITFKESEVLSPGNSLTTFDTDMCKIGIGICYDMRFFELAAVYRNEGCDIILYPGAFNITTGPMHWQALLKARAIDNQVYVAGIAPAQDVDAEYVAWGHSTLVDPYGQIVGEAGFQEDIIYGEIDMEKIVSVREQIPISYQKRPDLYRIVYAK